MTAELAVEALNNAILTQGVDKGLIVHTDLGSQYISNDFENKLNSFSISHSYSKKGYPYDNASMESFNSVLKKEEVNRKKYNTFEEAKLSIFKYIESWYNRKRIHGTLGYITPEEKEQLYTIKNINS